MSTERLRRLLSQDVGQRALSELTGATAHEKAEFLKLAKEAAQRSCESLKLYQPLPFQEAFHKSRAKECLIVKGNRAGGSLAGFAEDARAVIGADPYDKYPKKDGTCVCLGFGEKHIGRVIHKFLFRAGGFQIVRDLETMEWRVFRPWPAEKGGDRGRESETKPAPPLIPPRFIEELIWENRGDRVFSVCRMKTGWEIIALNSAGDPSQAQGFDVHLYHIDEDTASLGWYEEAVGRVAMTSGYIRWTALPHSKNDDILNMMQRADEEKDMENPTTVCIRASMFDNPYYPEESQKANLKIWAAQGDDVVRKRAYGEMVLDSVLMYPTFSKWTHDIVTDDDNMSPVQKAWKDAGNGAPPNWCRDLIVDPGHTIAAVLFVATPPPIIGDFHVIYDELYIHQCTAEILGNRIAEKAKDCQFERFIIDAHGGRLTDFGSGIRPQRLYENELAKHGVSCNMTGSYFISGSEDINGREECLRRWLMVGATGHPTVYVDVQRCPNLVREIQRFKKKTQRVGGQVVTLDEANRRAACHAVECAEYASANGLVYVKPKESKIVSSWVKRVIQDRKVRETQRRMRNGPSSVGTISLSPRGAK